MIKIIIKDIFWKNDKFVISGLANSESHKTVCCGSSDYGCVGSTMSLNRKNMCKHKKSDYANGSCHRANSCTR